MGRALGLRWARNGHSVLFGSRDPAKAKAVAETAATDARPGTFADAAAFGEVVLWTIREPLPSAVLGRSDALAGKILIDCNNSEIPPDFRFPPPIPSLAERIAVDAVGAREAGRPPIRPARSPT